MPCDSSRTSHGRQENMPTTKNILLNYASVIAVTIIFILVVEIVQMTDFFYHFHLFFILFGLLLHYHLTNQHRFILTVLSFFLNFIAWTAEQVNIESTFHNTPLYQSQDNRFFVVILGAFLWATNKVILDFIFGLFKATTKDMRLETMFIRTNTQ